jgi:hypothetical protein
MHPNLSTSRSFQRGILAGIVLLASTTGTARLSAQDLSASTSSLAFGDVFTDNPQILTLTVSNSGSLDLTLDRIRAFGEGFLLDDTSLVVPAGGSADLDLTFAPRHNLPRNGELILEPIDAARMEPLRVDLTGRGVYPDSYYDPTQDLSQEALKTALTNLIDGHTALGYSPARDEMYMVIDNWAVNGIGAAVNTLETAYTGRLVAGYANRSDAQSSSSIPGRNRCSALPIPCKATSSTFTLPMPEPTAAAAICPSAW